MSDAPSLPAGLYVAATPIGNLGDASPRLAAVLGGVDLLLCEDTRVTGRLCQHLGVRPPLQRYDDHNGAAVRPDILARLSRGERIGLVSDAGTPLIADPGFKLVRAVRAEGHAVHAVPGPSAAIAALSIAGVPTDRFTFAGFLPPKAGARASLLSELGQRGETLVFYETGPRLAASLTAIAETLGEGPVVIARELTKLYEEVVEGEAGALAARYADAPPKGEIVLIVPPREKAEASDADVEALMAEALTRLSLKDASAEVAARTGRKKRDLYQAWARERG